MITTNEEDGHLILVSHSNDHFVLPVREARDLLGQLTRALRDVPPSAWIDMEEDG